MLRTTLTFFLLALTSALTVAADEVVQSRVNGEVYGAKLEPSQLRQERALEGVRYQEPKMIYDGADELISAFGGNRDC